MHRGANQQIPEHLRDESLKLEHQLCFSLYTASRMVIRSYKPLLERLGLTYPQYLVMLVLWEWALPEHDQHPNARSVGELGERLRLDSGTLTPLLKRLELSGLVRRTRSTEDERRVELSLTAAGEALKERAYDIPQALVCALDVPVEDLIALRAQVDALLLRP